MDEPEDGTTDQPGDETDEPEDDADGEETQHGDSPIQPVAPDLLEGTQLGGYRIERLIGRGGMGVVYLATHLHLDRTVAVKVLGTEFAQNQDFRERFLFESRAAASVNDPNIITVYDAGEADGLLYIAMKYVDGPDLGELLERKGAQEPRRAVAILRQVGAALDAAHKRGIVHRDVKPANVLIDSEHCYLTDFGLAKSITSQAALTRAGDFVGTVHYIAPEQIKGKDVDARTDVYAFGCLAYHMLTGRVPFERESQVTEVYAHLEEPPPAPSAEKPELPIGMDMVLATALAKRKEDRQPACGAVVAALEAALDGGADAPSPREGSEKVTTLVVVAGEPRTRALVRGSLKGGRLRVLEATDARTASAVTDREQPELAIIDWEGTSAAASEICRALRERSQTDEFKVLALVDRGPAAGADARQDGADDYIVKPPAPLQLKLKVRDLLGLEEL